THHNLHSFPTRRSSDLTSCRMSKRATSLFFVVVVHHKACMNDSGNPAQQGQEDAQKKTCDPSGHQYRQRREHHTEKIPQRFHFRSEEHTSELQSRENLV